MTNLEWLRTLSAEELVDFMSVNSCRRCLYCDGNCTDDNHDCTEGKVAWLNAEHKKELKPCPFCGGNACIDNAIVSKESGIYGKVFIYCKGCPAVVGGMTEKEARRNWNRRAEHGN